MPDKSKILLLCDAPRVFEHAHGDLVNKVFNIGFTARVTRLRKKLIKNDTGEVIVIGMDSVAVAKLGRAKIPHKSFEEYASETMFSEACETAAALLRGNHTLQSNPLFKDSLYYNGIFLWELMECYNYAITIQMILDIELVKRIMDIEKPATVAITDSESMVGKAAVAVAKARGIAVCATRRTLILYLKHLFNRFLKIHIERAYLKMKVPQVNLTRGARRRAYVSRGNSLSQQKRKILMLSDELRHAPQVIPWAKELVRNKGNELLIIGGDLWPRQYEELNDCFRTFSQYFDKGLSKKARRTAKVMIKNWHRLEGHPTLKECIVYDGIPMVEILKEDISFGFRCSFDRIIEYIELTNRIVDYEKPDIIVVMDERSQFGKTTVRACNLKGVPTLVLQHGIQEDEPIYGPTYADKMSVYGEYARRILIKRGVNPDKIVITGCSQWDELVKGEGISREEFCRQLGLDKDKKIILLATHIGYQRDIGRKVLIGVLNAVRQFPGTQLLIRAHPGEPISTYRSIAKEVGAGDVVVFKKPHDFDSIRACDILITQYSTLGLEAMIAGKPVITILLSSGPNTNSYTESGAAIGVNRTEDIAPAIEDALNNRAVQERLALNREKFIYDQAYKLDGKASERVAGLIEGMIQE